MPLGVIGNTGDFDSPITGSSPVEAANIETWLAQMDRVSVSKTEG